MPDNIVPDKVPDSLHKFFWDVDPKKINPQKHPYYVINRLLDKGDLEAARWVCHNYSKDQIIETFRKRRDFSFPTAVFWVNYLSISRKEVRCLQEPYYSLRRKLWPY